MRKLELHWQILLAIVLAAVIGGVVGDQATIAGSFRFVDLFDFIGTLFLNALKMIIVPLVTSSIVVGVAGIGDSGNLGRLGGKTIAFYATTTLLAILIGLALINVVGPGYDSNGEPVRDILALTEDTSDVRDKIEGKGAGDFAGVFLRMVPPNIFAAATDNGQLLGLIFFALLFGYFLTRLPDSHRDPMFTFWDGVFRVMTSITEFVMKLAPIGVFGLVAETVAQVGLEGSDKLLGVLLTFSAVVVAALAFHVFLTLPLLMRVVGLRPYSMLAKMSPAMLTAFSTASSSATLPVTMDCVENRVGVSRRISSFVLPLGATVNMNGTALYECTAAMFLAQAYGLELGFSVQVSIVLIALLTSIGVAGVPHASLVAIAVILESIGLPVEAIGVLLVFDRVLDMARTAVNIFGDSCCATIVARLEGEETTVASTPIGAVRPEDIVDS
ncbi:MAG: dicarboxylate/amino acid:cation symporter [Pseudomonadota bacterium]